jgi:hypothetical protein
MLDQYEQLNMFAQCELTSQWTEEPLNKYFKDDMSQKDSAKLSQVPDMSQDQYISDFDVTYKYDEEQSYEDTCLSPDTITNHMDWCHIDVAKSAQLGDDFDANLSRIAENVELAQESDVIDVKMFEKKVLTKPKYSGVNQVLVTKKILKEHIEDEAKVVYCLNRKDVVIKR